MSLIGSRPMPIATPPPGGAVRKAAICAFLIFTLLASATFAQAQVACLDDGFQRVFGNMSQHTNANQGNPPQAQDPCTTGITFRRGEVMQVCAKGTVELNAVKTVMPEGGVPSAGSGWRSPGSPEGALLGVIGSVIFPLGRCASIPAPAAGVLNLVVNDESGAYADNTGSFKVLVSNLATGEGSTVGVSGFTVAGVSTPQNWSFGLGATAAGGPTVVPLAVNVVNTVAGGAGPAGLDTLFVNGVNDPVAGFGARLDPFCTCASCGAPGGSGPALGAAYGCPIAGASFTVLNGGAALFMYTGPALGPAAAPCGGPVGAPGAPATPGAVGTCPFNPTLFGGVGLLLSGGNPGIPALSPMAMVLLMGLILGAGAYLIMRRRSSQPSA